MSTDSAASGTGQVPTLHIGYVLRVFPSLAQTFVINEIKALEALGVKVTVLALNPAASHRCLAADALHHGDLINIEGSAPTSAWLWLLRQHPLRLVRVLTEVATARSPHLRRALAKAVRVAHLAELAGVGHLHAHLRLGTDTAWLVHRLTGRRFSFTAHSGNLFVAKMTRFLARELQAADFAVTVCHSNRALMAAREPAAVGKIHVIRPFLHAELLQQCDLGRRCDPSPSRVRRDRSLHLISVARLVAKKGLGILVEAIGMLARRQIDVRLFIVGEGRERCQIEQRINALDLGERIRLLGARSHSEVRRLIAAADALVLASVQTPNGDADATPTVLGEAMAMGLPVVSTRLSGIPEVVPEGAGLLVPPGDPSALADAIGEITTMPAERRQAMGMCGRRFVREHWNGNEDVHRLAALFRRGIDDRCDSSSA
jgi:glycosyltransferase involved in cell wall biosynthesis